MARKSKKGSTGGDSLRRREEVPEVPPSSSIDNLIVIGASAGGYNALKEVLRDLSQDIPAAVIIMQHQPGLFSDAAKFGFKDWLQQATRIPVVQVSDGALLRMGVVYVVPPGMSVTLLASMFRTESYDRGIGPIT